MNTSNSPVKVKRRGKNTTFFAYPQTNGTWKLKSWDGRRVGETYAVITEKYFNENFRRIN